MKINDTESVKRCKGCNKILVGKKKLGICTACERKNAGLLVKATSVLGVLALAVTKFISGKHK